MITSNTPIADIASRLAAYHAHVGVLELRYTMLYIVRYSLIYSRYTKKIPRFIQVKMPTHQSPTSLPDLLHIMRMWASYRVRGVHGLLAVGLFAVGQFTVKKC